MLDILTPDTAQDKVKSKKSSDAIHDVDSEYQPRTDDKTELLTVQVATAAEHEIIYNCYTNPNAPLTPQQRRHPIFNSPIALIDSDPRYSDYRWSNAKTIGTEIAEARMFKSLKDIESLFADESVYRAALLPYVEKTRRYRLDGLGHKDYVIIRNKEGNNLQVRKKDDKGNSRWYNFAIRITDIGALMAGSLLEVATATGHDMSETKTIFSQDEKARMLEMYLTQPDRFDLYAKGDVLNYFGKDSNRQQVMLLSSIMGVVRDQFNQIAVLLGVKPLPEGVSWGMSTGVSVARLITAAISAHTGIPVSTLTRLAEYGGSKSLTQFGRYLGKKDNFIYLTEVDGGRANNEVRLKPNTHYGTVFKNRKVNGIYTGVLCDIDISGCYANGLMNQSLFFGVPQVVLEPMSLKDFFEKYYDRLVPNGWTARINWKDAWFQQDLLISKIPEAYTDWDYGIDGYTPDGFSYEADEDKTYDAGMLVTTRSVHQAALTHDLLQILQTVSSKAEWKWLLENAVVTGLLYYDKDLEVTEPTPAMVNGIQISEAPDVHTTCDKHWLRFELKDIMKILIPKRNEAKRIFGKKSSQELFLKLVNNTIYGCIASAFFNTEDTILSNVVAGNNITARARALAWLMVKGLGTLYTATDGGAFDLNRVIHWKHRSLNNMANLYDGICYDKSRNKTYVRKPLLAKTLTDDVLNGYEGWQSPARGESDFLEVYDTTYLQDDIDSNAWRHLKQEFPGVDLLEGDFFTFESKCVFLGFTPHNKVNYCLYDILAGENAGKPYKIALRGMSKVKDKNGESVVNPEALKLFEAYERGEAIVVTQNNTQMLSLAQWHALKNSNPELHNRLLPDDQISDCKSFYSITPLNIRYETMEQYISVQKKYQDAKASGDPHRVAAVTKASLTDDEIEYGSKRMAKLSR